MPINLLCDLRNPPIGALVAVELIKSSNPVSIEWNSKESSIKYANNTLSNVNNNDLLRVLAREATSYQLYGKTPLERTQIDHWLTFSLSFDDNVDASIQYLNKSLASLTYLVSNKLTIADLAVFNELFASYEGLKKNGLPSHVQRWYDLISSHPAVQQALKSLPKDAKLKKTQERQRESTPNSANVGDRKQEGKFVDLPGAEMGKVIVRFPPEASGYLHIGHAKAALLNQYYQQAFQGTLIMRFDDTNPAKENVHFEKVILEDLEMLEIKPDLFTHTSQYFDLMLEYCEKLMKEGKAYVDDTEPEIMKLEREQRVESKNRSNSVEKNFELWREMVAGSQRGQKCCVRAKIDMSSPNGCLRDPTIYRCKNEPHPRTGTQYKVYPTYDFACPIVDAIENVTHTLRTMEYHDRDDQFYWFIDALKLRKPYIWEYARLNMTNTVLSKRKLTWFVEEGLVDGWDDPRFPTVRGVLRRGMTVEGLKQFIIAQGSSKSVVFMEWDKIWAFNKKVIDPIAPRYTALDNENRVVVNVAGAKLEATQIPLHPKNRDVGMKTVWTGPQVLIDYADAECLKEGENATFINWGNLLIKKINKSGGKITSIDADLNLDNKDYKKTIKLTWLCQQDPKEYPPTFCVYFEHIISKPVLSKDEDFKNYIGHETRSEVQMLGDPELKKCKKGDIIQLQRRGFFKVDQAWAPASEFSGVEQPIVLFFIPDGHTKEMPTSGLSKKVQAAENKEKSKGSAGQVSDLNEKINKQGDVVRNLKAQKADKRDVDAAVKLLLFLKEEFKVATGSDWKPGATAATEPPKKGSASAQAQKLSANTASTGQVSDLNEKIILQGEVVRNLKAQKADKLDVDAAVKTLLGLKVEFKAATGSDWKPGVSVAADAPKKQASSTGQVSDLNEKIILQGDTVRNLKAQKADKLDVDAAVKTLLQLKTDYKSATGSDWKPGVAVTADASKKQASSTGQVSDLNEKIILQGDTVRNLKAQKADKLDVDAAVKTLLQLKTDYKSATGSDWKPGVAVTADASKKQASSTGQVSDLNEKIILQGDTVRNLKAQKADKLDVDAAVKTLLQLKTDYKSATGSDWKPGVAVTADASKKQASSTGQVSDLNEKIILQGDTVRNLKAQKADKLDVDAAVKTLLQLKTDYKSATGSDWKPGVAVTADASKKQASSSPGQVSDLNEKIILQGDTVRNLKAQKANKLDVDTAVKTLLQLKADYKKASGEDWKPDSAPAPVKAQNKENMEPTSKKDELTKKINEQGNVVRQLKTNKAAPKDDVDKAVQTLLLFKAEYKTVTGEDFPVAGRQPQAPKESKPKESKPKEAPKDKKKPEPKKAPAADTKDDASGVKKQTRLGLEAKKEENLPDWYSQVITKGELIEYYDVSGCYILRPWSFAIWKNIKRWFDDKICSMGVKECYFPIFVSKAALEKEKDHIADFAPEVAWVTKSGDSELAEPIAVRPTSETVMYPAYAKWIQSYRDLPIRLNQWNNVVRWEFKHPQPFLRTREFLWQEGHTAFATEKEAQKEVYDILELYKQVYTDLMAIPVVKGRKTEKEKFAGGDFTTTVEAYVSASGRGIQGATSHYLGQNFAKMFDIVFIDPETKEKQYVFQNSWGITTRTIGVMVMIHADNQGLVLPPRVACVQVVIVPCGITATSTDEERSDLIDACKELEADICIAGARVEGDYRDNYSPGWKYNHWELKGVPIRIELGPKDIKASQFVAVRRDTGEKLTIPRKRGEKEVVQLLVKIHESMLAKATKDLKDHTKITKDWKELTAFLDAKNIIMAPFCGEIPCEEKIKADSARDDAEGDVQGPAMGAKSLCIPFEQPAEILASDKCIHPACSHKPKFYVLFGRSY